MVRVIEQHFRVERNHFGLRQNLVVSKKVINYGFFIKKSFSNFTSLEHVKANLRLYLIFYLAMIYTTYKRFVSILQVFEIVHKKIE